MAISACIRIWSINCAEPMESGSPPPPDPAWVGSIPPVSTISKTLPAHSAWVIKRSRVVPGTSSTTARRSSARRLNRVLFPTFGRPTRATMGLGISTSSGLGGRQGGRQGDAGRCRCRGDDDRYLNRGRQDGFHAHSLRYDIHLEFKLVDTQA